MEENHYTIIGVHTRLHTHIHTYMYTNSNRDPIIRPI